MSDDGRELVWSTSHWGGAEPSLPALDAGLTTLLLEHISTRVAVLDRDRCYLYANREALRFMGLPVDQVIGRHMSQVLDAGVCERFMPLLDRLFAGESLHLRGWVHYERQGRRYREQLLVPYSPGGGPVQAVVVCGLDHTEQRLGEEELAQKREALRQSDKLSAMGALLAGVSHELNNPLAIVMGRARLLEEKCEQQPDLLQDALRIREAAERCGRIVRTFLNMARSRPSRRHPLALADAVHAAADMLAYSYRSHDIELRLQFAAGLPDISADGDQVCQVVLNLLVNAQQALAAVDGARQVTVATGADGPQLWLRVADNGPGVPTAVRSRIFEAFFTTKAEGLGTGMGLSVSRALAREHGGDLLLEDDPPGGGAAFCLRLPVAGPADDAAAPMAQGAVDAPGPARVLVVDDEPELSAVMREMLEGAGHEVATAESGAVALQLLAAARFDAVVSDLRMPDMDGAALWREVCAHHPALRQRLLFVTGDTLSPAASEFLRRSGCDGLDKPFVKGELLAKVAALLRRGETNETGAPGR